MIEIAELDPIGRVHDNQFPDFRLWGLRNFGQVINGVPGTPGADEKATDAWSLHTAETAVVVAVLDTGVSQSHPNTATIQVPGMSGDPGSPSSTDDNGVPTSHGTICAGIIAGAHIAQNDYAGVAWGAKVMPIKIASASGQTGGNWASPGVTWAADHGARILSMSFGLGYSSVFDAACQYAHSRGLLLVASSGNIPGGQIAYPAAWSSIVMCVGATDNTDHLANFTTTGPAMDVAAPGVNIWSCVDENPVSGGHGWNTFAFEDGTSFAARRSPDLPRC